MSANALSRSRISCLNFTSQSIRACKVNASPDGSGRCVPTAGADNGIQEGRNYTAISIIPTDSAARTSAARNKTGGGLIASERLRKGRDGESAVYRRYAPFCHSATAKE